MGNMSKHKETIHIAVVGLGPRGLGAVEAAISHFADSGLSLSFELFDPIQWPGAGPNFKPTQSSNCVLNIPIREIDVAPDPRLGLDIGNFAEWLDADHKPDEFPTRAKLGEYFAQRFQQLIESPGHLSSFQYHQVEVDAANYDKNGWRLYSSGNDFGPFDEVVLTQGQADKKPDPQINEWLAHAGTTNATLISAYPEAALSEAAEKWTDRTVAIRGLGLSTFDVFRVLTSGAGGKFERGVYRRSGREPAQILPFSLNGQPPVPKPGNSALDSQFDPSSDEAKTFESALRSALAGESDRALHVLCEALVGPVVRILGASGARATKDEVEAWLATERETPGSQEHRAPIDALKNNIAIARAKVAPSVEYTVGQVWRKWQKELRTIYRSSYVSEHTARVMLGFDEALKRVSYGPPLRSAEELLALIEAELVSLSVADDPDVVLTKGGWQICEDDERTRVSVMVDAVLPSPELEGLTDDLMNSLLKQGFAREMGDDLGAMTHRDGRVIIGAGTPLDGLSILGRMSLGSVIAADSIHDCFGDTTRQWAEGVFRRAQSACAKSG